MSEVIGKHYLDLDIHQNNYVSFTCKQDNSAEHIYVTIYDNGEHINNLTTLLTSLDVKIETPDSRHLKLSTSDVWQRCKKDDVGAILITSNNISTYRPYILDIAVGEYVRKGTSELITITNDTVEIHLPQSVFLENGRCKGEIVLIQDNNQLATMDFQINIIKSVYTDKEIIDDAYTESEVAQLKNYISGYVKHAENSAINAAVSEENASSSATTAINKASEASTSATNAKTSETNAKTSETNASSSATIATTKASEASTSATKAKNSETNAKSSENVAIAKANEADVSANNAKTSETNASNSATLSKSWAVGGTGTRTNEDTNNSKYYSTQASNSAQNAKTSETNAKTSETSAASSANTATTKASAAATSATNASNSAKTSESYARGGTGTRTGEDTDNAKYYYEQTKQVSQSLNGIIPKGTVAFANLPTSGMKYGDMYNISDAFMSDTRFNDGGGVYYGAGNNVIWVSGDKWDVTAGSGVTGVKGANEDTYRQGNVDITPENIGALAEDGNAVSATKATQDGNGNNIVGTYQTKTGDVANNTASFSVASSRSNISTGEKMSTILGKIAKFFMDLKSVAFTGSYNDLTNKPTIPSVGNGTVTIKQAGTSKGTFTMNQSGNTTIELTDNNTTYSSKAAVSGGTDVSLVTTGEKATWNAKTSNTGTITQVKANGTSIATSGVANIPAASTSAYGVTKLTSDLTGNSESLAATQKAVNTLNSNFNQSSLSFTPSVTNGTVTSFRYIKLGNIVFFHFVGKSTTANNLTFTVPYNIQANNIVFNAFYGTGTIIACYRTENNTVLVQSNNMNGQNVYASGFYFTT